MLTRTRLNDLAKFAAVLLFFFVSGACGLLYQVVWTRKLVLILGTTSYAVSTVLSIFFIGLGAGALLGGRLADRTRSPLFLYGLFEILVGVWALIFIFAIGHGESAAIALLKAFSAGHAAGIAVRVALAFAFLIVPVVLMGATLPLLAKFASTDSNLRGLRIGSLYSVNTFGAVLGCAAAGFAILPAMGYTNASLLGAAANAVIGILAILLATMKTPEPRENSNSDGSGLTDESVESIRSPFLPLAAFAVSGFCALAFEVLWTRLLTLVFVGTTYAFTTMLTALLCGIALGSAFASLLIDRIRRRVALFGLVEILIGLACVLMLPVFQSLPQRLSEMSLDAGYQWAELVRAKFYLSFAALFIPTFLFGMTFPIAVKALTSTGARLGRDIGRLYSANTLGGFLGALIGGFALIPMLGAHRGIIALSVTLLIVGIVLVAVSELRVLARLIVSAAACVLMFLCIHTAPADISQAMNRGYIPETDRVLFYREGVEGTVAVSEAANNSTESNRTLWINAVQATASIEKGVKMNRFQGILPLLFDRNPRDVLFMCLGSGITAGTLALYDFDHIDAVEISPDVLEATQFFAKDNFDARSNPKVRFTIDDGRNFLLTTPNTYDVITFEPMPLALAGVSTFYTLEYYRLCLQHLNPGGIVSQWIPLHSLDPGVVRSLVGTFTTAFPDYCAWFVNADLFMVGSNQPLHIDPVNAAKRLEAPELLKAIRMVGFKDIAEIMSCFFMGKQNVDRYCADAGQGVATPCQALMTDDRPWAEFIAPKLMFLRTVHKTLEQLTPYFEAPTNYFTFNRVPEGMSSFVRSSSFLRYKARVKNLEGLKLYYGGMFGSGPDKFFKQALDIDPEDQNSRYYLKEIAIASAKTYAGWDDMDKAVTALNEAIHYAPDYPELYLTLADICHDHNRPEEAQKNYQLYINMGGKEPRAAERAGKQ